MSDIRKWLDDNGLSDHATLFESQKITLELLPEIVESDLEAMGIPLGDRKRILSARSSPASLSKRQLTVVFCDMVGSTQLSTQLDEESLRKEILFFREICKSSIERYGGYVHQYSGDAVVSYFGYPHGQERSAVRAAAASLAIVN
jgi:class 3 adenylate cyclase